MNPYVALDNCLSPRLKVVLDALYGRFGFKFIHVEEDLHAGTAEDEFWAERYRRFGGQVVLSGDINIAYRPHQHAAFIDNGLTCYFPSKSWAKLRLHEQAAFICHQWHGIMPHLKENQGPGCWRFTCTGSPDDVRLRPAAFTKLEVPAEVLDKARRSRAPASR